MNDCKGKKIEAGQKVVFSVGTTLVTGEVVAIRNLKGMEIYPIAKIRLDNPETRMKNARWVVNKDDVWEKIGEPMPPRVFRECGDKHRILILDNSDK